MIFLSKRTNGHEHSSNKEVCLSSIGLLLAVGLIGGLGGLIYGLKKNSISGIIGGAIIFGISFFLIILFILMIVFCFKNNNIDSNPNHHQQQQPQQQIYKNSLKQKTTISTIEKYEPTNDLNITQIHMKSPDNKNHDCDKQITPLSPLKPSTFTFLNQSDSSTNSNIIKHNNYNGH